MRTVAMCSVLTLFVFAHLAAVIVGLFGERCRYLRFYEDNFTMWHCQLTTTIMSTRMQTSLLLVRFVVWVGQNLNGDDARARSYIDAVLSVFGCQNLTHSTLSPLNPSLTGEGNQTFMIAGKLLQNKRTRRRAHGNWARLKVKRWIKCTDERCAPCHLFVPLCLAIYLYWLSPILNNLVGI